MSDWHPTMEQRREYKLTPYMTEDGAWVADHLAWAGKCSGCGESCGITVGIDRPAMVFLNPHPTVNVVESSYDKHVCIAQPFRLNRPLNPDDMAHPIVDAKFVPDEYTDMFGFLEHQINRR